MSNNNRRSIPFPVARVKSLSDYILRTFYAPVGQGGCLNNARHQFIGFFGHVKLMEALIALYAVTRDLHYLKPFRKMLAFCREKVTQSGIEDWWTIKREGSNWIESNHLGIVAYTVYEYWRATKDPTYNVFAEQLMNCIPKLSTSGAYIDGYDALLSTLDNREYLADNSEILLGWWACWKLTGNRVYKRKYEELFQFLDVNFHVIDDQPDCPAWVVGPKHVPYAEGTDNRVYCDQSHTTYSQFFISRDIVLVGDEARYSQLVQSVEWVKKYALFDDDLVGYNERDDKLVGWSAYFAAQCYFAYCITGDESYYEQAKRSLVAVWALQDSRSGKVRPYIPVHKRVNWADLETNRAGLGEIWQMAAILEASALIDRMGKEWRR